jgi:hypothetical protein
MENPMKNVSIRILLTAFIVIVGMPDVAPTQDAKRTLTYEKNIEPIIKNYCLPCHLSDSENPSGLVLDTYETLMEGGEHGKAVISGKAKESNLYLKLLPNPPFGKQMSRGRKKLTKEEVQLIFEWIEQGAKKE